jgi:UDP-N-acetylmuramoyl-L-alanyl-D-glutamate--2,6-diaminopimelate ligase
VFGAAGLRDVAKRRWMGTIAGESADCVVITAEDPRTESLREIMEEIAAGCRAAGGVQDKSYWLVADRAAAIGFAVQRAAANDVVLACGKAHEQSMCFGEVEFPWDERTVMRAALAVRLGHPAIPAPVLPTAV